MDDFQPILPAKDDEVFAPVADPGMGRRPHNVGGCECPDSARAKPCPSKGRGVINKPIPERYAIRYRHSPHGIDRTIIEELGAAESERDEIAATCAATLRQLSDRIAELDAMQDEFRSYTDWATAAILKEKDAYRGAAAKNVTLADTLRGIYQQVAGGRLCYFGDHTGYQQQFGSDETERWKQVLEDTQGT